MGKQVIFQLYVAIVLIIVISTYTGCVAAKNKAGKQEWIELFNGKDINGWVVKINHHEVGEDPANTFRVEDGIIKVRYETTSLIILSQIHQNVNSCCISFLRVCIGLLKYE